MWHTCIGRSAAAQHLCLSCAALDLPQLRLDTPQLLKPASALANPYNCVKGEQQHPRSLFYHMVATHVDSTLAYKSGTARGRAGHYLMEAVTALAFGRRT